MDSNNNKNIFELFDFDEYENFMINYNKIMNILKFFNYELVKSIINNNLNQYDIAVKYINDSFYYLNLINKEFLTKNPTLKKLKINLNDFDLNFFQKLNEYLKNKNIKKIIDFYNENIINNLKLNEIQKYKININEYLHDEYKNIYNLYFIESKKIFKNKFQFPNQNFNINVDYKIENFLFDLKKKLYEKDNENKINYKIIELNSNIKEKKIFIEIEVNHSFNVEIKLYSIQDYYNSNIFYLNVYGLNDKNIKKFNKKNLNKLKKENDSYSKINIFYLINEIFNIEIKKLFNEYINHYKNDKINKNINENNFDKDKDFFISNYFIYFILFYLSNIFIQYKNLFNKKCVFCKEIVIFNKNKKNFDLPIFFFINTNDNKQFNFNFYHNICLNI